MPEPPLSSIESRLAFLLGEGWESVLRVSYPDLHRMLMDLRLDLESLEFIRKDKDLMLIGFSVWKEQVSYFEDLAGNSEREFRAAARNAGIGL